MKTAQKKQGGITYIIKIKFLQQDYNSQHLCTKNKGTQDHKRTLLYTLYYILIFKHWLWLTSKPHFYHRQVIEVQLNINTNLGANKLNGPYRYLQNISLKTKVCTFSRQFMTFSPKLTNFWYANKVSTDTEKERHNTLHPILTPQIEAKIKKIIGKKKQSLHIHGN